MSETLKSPGQMIIRQTESGGSVKGTDVGVLYILGVFECGEVGKPTVINNPQERKQKLGGYISGFYGAKAIDLAFMQGGISKVVAVRTAHYSNGVPTAVKANVMLAGYNEEIEDRPKLSTCKITAISEGAFGNRLNISTLKAKTTLSADAAGICSFLSVQSISGFEVGDLLDVSDGTHYFRAIITSTNGLDRKLFIKPVSLGNTFTANVTLVRTASSHFVCTTLKTGTTLQPLATTATLTSMIGVNIGATITIADTREASPMAVTVKVTGVSGDTIQFDSIGIIEPIEAAYSRVVSQEFLLDVYLDADRVGKRIYASMNAANEKAFIGNVFKNDYVTVSLEPSTEGLLGVIPEAREHVYLAGGTDGLTDLSDADFIGSAAVGNGFYVFDTFPRNFAQIICPDGRSATVQKALQDCAERNRLWFEADIDFGTSYTEAGEFITETALLQSEFGRVNYPNVQWTNPETGVLELIPQSAAVAGMNAYVWSKKTPGYGPWTQPAGIDYPLKGVLGLENDDTVAIGVRDYLYERRINPIYKFPNVGFIVNGIRLLSTAGTFTQVGEAVTFLYCEHSIANDVFWNKFSNIDGTYRGQGMQRIKKFLDTVWRNGGLKGVLPAKPDVSQPDGAYFIDINSLNNAETEMAGEFFWKIGLATKKAGEFIYFVFQRKSVE